LDRYPAIKSGSQTRITSAVDGTGKNVTNNGMSSSTNITFAFEGTGNTGVILFLQCNLDDIVKSGEHGVEHGISTPGSTHHVCLVPDNITQHASGNYTYTDLDTGNHTFKVRTVDNEYNVDDTPAVFNWTIQPIS
jgi:hypothetical protein